MLKNCYLVKVNLRKKHENKYLLIGVSLRKHTSYPVFLVFSRSRESRIINFSQPQTFQPFLPRPFSHDFYFHAEMA